MVKDIRKRVEESFDENDKERILKYMDWINSSIIDYVKNVRRNVSILLLLVAIFELVVGSRNTTLSIGSFSISRDSIALVFLPAIVSVLFLQTVLDTSKAGRLYGAFSDAFKIWSPKASENKLDLVFDQPQPAYWTPFIPVYDKDDMDSIDKFEDIISSVSMAVVAIGAVVFEGQAYYVLFPERIATVFVWVASLLVTLFCLVMSLFLWAGAT